MYDYLGIICLYGVMMVVFYILLSKDDYIDNSKCILCEKTVYALKNRDHSGYLAARKLCEDCYKDFRRDK